MTILLNGTFFVQNKCCAVGGILWNFHVVFRWLSQLHNSTAMVLSITMRIHQDLWPHKILSCPAFKWNYLKLSDDFRRILKTNENKWKYLKIFWWLSENKWNYLKLSDDFRHCLKLPHLRREPSVFFSQKKTTRRNVIARGFGGLAPPSAVTKFNFCCFKKQQNWLWKQQILGSQTEKVRLTYLSTEVDVYVNFSCRKLLILRHFFGFSSNSII